MTAGANKQLVSPAVDQRAGKVDPASVKSRLAG
jgi:hypothetical protein